MFLSDRSARRPARHAQDRLDRQGRRAAQEGLLSSPRWRSISFNPAQFSDGETPPPKAAFMLLDRPMPVSAEGLEPTDHAERTRPGLVIRAADRPRGAAGSDGHGG